MLYKNLQRRRKQGRRTEAQTTGGDRGERCVSEPRRATRRGATPARRALHAQVGKPRELPDRRRDGAVQVVAVQAPATHDSTTIESDRSRHSRDQEMKEAEAMWDDQKGEGCVSEPRRMTRRGATPARRALHARCTHNMLSPVSCPIDAGMVPSRLLPPKFLQRRRERARARRGCGRRRAERAGGGGRQAAAAGGATKGASGA